MMFSLDRPPHNSYFIHRHSLFLIRTRTTIKQQATKEFSHETLPNIHLSSLKTGFKKRVPFSFPSIFEALASQPSLNILIFKFHPWILLSGHRYMDRSMILSSLWLCPLSLRLFDMIRMVLHVCWLFLLQKTLFICVPIARVQLIIPTLLDLVFSSSLTVCYHFIQLSLFLM